MTTDEEDVEMVGRIKQLPAGLTWQSVRLDHGSMGP